MSLDKSWDEKGENINQLDDFDAPGDYYLQGASDFQKKAIEELTQKYNYCDDILEKCSFKLAIDIIKPLKAE